MTVPGVRVRVRGYDYYQDGGGSGSPVVFTPTQISLTDPTEFAYIQTATHTVYPDPVTGYFYADLIATNDPDLTPFLWRVTFDGRSFLIEVDYLAAVVDVGGGLMLPALWLTEAASPDNVPLNPTAYYTSTQTDSRIGTAIGVHNVAGDSHGDLRALIAAVTAPVTSVNTRTGAVVGLAEQSSLAAHTGDTTNPHAVTKAQVGLGNADNTSDASKPLSSAATTALAAKADASALTAHAGNTSNPHSVTAAQVGLGNVTNTSDANKPVSTAQQAALDTKMAKASNLSDLTNTGTARTNLGLGGASTLSVGTTAGTVAAGDDSRFGGSTVTVPADKTTNYTLVLGDANSSIGYNSASAGTFTIPPNSSVAFPVGSVVEARQVGAGRVAFAAGAGVTMRAADGYVTTRVQYSAMCALKVATDTWNISGDVAV